MRRRQVAAAGVFAVLVGSAAALVAVQVGLRASRAEPPRPWPILPPASATIDIGATTLPLARNSYRPWVAKDLETVNALEQAIHKHLSVVMWYADWAHEFPLLEQLEAVGERGSVPEITWEPWNSLAGGIDQPLYRLRNIIEGRFDTYIRSWAKVIASYGKPVRLRFAQEMNGNWYPWSEQVNGNSRGEFALAWKHIHRIFDAVGATNTVWVWSAARPPVGERLYPGDAFVDIVSTTIFNGGGQLVHEPWHSFHRLLSVRLERLNVIAPGKPIEVSEIGCAEEGGDKTAWIHGLFAELLREPNVRSIVWYSLVKGGSDWGIDSSTSSAEAFQEEAADPRYR